MGANRKRDVRFYLRRSLPHLDGRDGRAHDPHRLAGERPTVTLHGRQTNRRKPSGVNEVRLGGHDQWISIRAADPDKPVMLWLAGGPGQSDLAFARTFFDGLARDFVVVDWDQRGAGKSYPALDPVATWTLPQAVSDTIELTNYLRERFDEEKIYLGGVSWGSTLGVLAVQEQPDLTMPTSAPARWSAGARPTSAIYRDCGVRRDRDDDCAERLRGYGGRPTTTRLPTPSSCRTTKSSNRNTPHRPDTRTSGPTSGSWESAVRKIPSSKS